MWILLIAALKQRKVRLRLFGSLRLAAYAFTVLAALTALSMRRAQAAFREQVFYLGDELKPISNLLDGTTRLRLNGQTLYVSMTTVQQTTVSQVLDRFEAVCREHPGPFSRKMNTLAALVPEALPGAPVVREALRELALNREQSSAHGTLSCMTQSGPSRRAPERNPLDEFMDTSDLGVLGDLKYVTVTQGSAREGEQNSVRVVTLFTEGQFRLDALAAPEVGDAPGTDSKLAPRPPGSSRLFSAEAVDAPYAVRVYETAQARADVLRFYETTLSDFEVVPTIAGPDDSGRAFLRQGQPLLVTVARNGDKTTVTLSEVGGGNRDPANLAARR